MNAKVVNKVIMRS